MIIRRTLDQIRSRGWHQGGFGDPDGTACCLLGGLVLTKVQEKQSDVSTLDCFAYDFSDVTDDTLSELHMVGLLAMADAEVRKAQILLTKVIQEQYPEGEYRSVPDFNDAPETTFADVERVLEKAALLEEEL